LFDEFDAVFRDMPAPLFRCLRVIRDSHKDQISYLVVSTHDLAGLRNDLADVVDHFYRLVSRNFCWLGPYCEVDARQMNNYLASRRNLELSEKDTQRLLELSGGHAGLLKAILSLLWNGDNPGVLTKPATVLAKESVIERECQKTWGNLSENEKADLCSFSNGDPLDEQTLDHLQDRGLLRQGKNNVRGVFSPLLASFIQDQAPPPQKGTYINRSPQVVQLDGRSIKNLTELEFELLFYLYKQRGHVCTKYDLVENVYRQQYNFRKDGLPDAMLQALISRLREKIEPDREHPKYVLTLRGEGYRFDNPTADK
jgi:DNA-binding winged helix-turn-helix (wHTH) protein